MEMVGTKSSPVGCAKSSPGDLHMRKIKTFFKNLASAFAVAVAMGILNQIGIVGQAVAIAHWALLTLVAWIAAAA